MNNKHNITGKNLNAYGIVQRNNDIYNEIRNICSNTDLKKSSVYFVVSKKFELSIIQIRRIYFNEKKMRNENQYFKKTTDY